MTVSLYKPIYDLLFNNMHVKTYKKLLSSFAQVKEWEERTFTIVIHTKMIFYGGKNLQIIKI